MDPMEMKSGGGNDGRKGKNMELRYAKPQDVKDIANLEAV